MDKHCYNLLVMGAVCPSWNFRCYLWHHGREESSRAGIKGRLSVVTRFSTPGEFLVGLWAVSFISPQRTLGSSTRGQKGRQVTYLGPPGHQSHTHHDISVRRTADMNFLFLSVNHNQRLQTGPPNEHSISPPTQCSLKPLLGTGCIWGRCVEGVTQSRQSNKVNVTNDLQ